MELNFRIVLVPSLIYDEKTSCSELDDLLLRLRAHIEHCGVKVLQLYFSQVKKIDNEDHPEIEELAVQVQAKMNSTNINNSKYDLYRDFLLKWKRSLPASLPCSYIVFYENESFERTGRRSVIDVQYKSISFGVLPHNGRYYQCEELSNDSLQYYIHFYDDTKNIIINYKGFEMTLSYDNIRNIYVNIDSHPCQIFFDLFNPPVIFRVNIKKTRLGESYKLRERAISFKDNSILSLLGDFSSRKPDIDVDILGRANVMCLSLTNPSLAEKIISSIHFCCSQKAVHYSYIIVSNTGKPPNPYIELNHFGCTYLLTAMVKRNFVMVAQARNVMNNVSSLKNLCLENSESLEKALTVVLSAIDSGKIINYWHAIEKQYRFYVSNTDEISYKHYLVPDKCRMIRRVMLTPTRQLLWCPEIMYGNRVLRNFDSEYALRVSFRDDNLSRLSFNAAYADEDVFNAAIRVPMTKGICIGSREFEFLAWSNSQIRDHGVWMYARDLKGNTAEKIRSWMGDFSHIHSVPKYMARMGQCFSQTEDAVSVPLDPTHVRVEEDIEGGYDPVNGKPYCFSDGVGKISLHLAQKVRAALGHDKLCSAFQIRYGGFKGMLVTDPTLKGVDIVFRKSMQKFNSPQNTQLEIAKTSGPVRAQLNRPFISILNDLGVRHRTFLKLQEEMLKILTDMLFNEEKASAFLESKTPSEIFKYKDLSYSGIYLTTEPFFRSLLLALHRHHIDRIKTRANIDIDPSEGRNLLGVLDETGELNYGEVFVQYTNDISFGETTRNTKILKGEVLVTKNPCLLPGDVRKFQAVDIPQLHHIVDCIVFPRKGPRPHPNEMAGSDLDGDEYLVLWKRDLIFHSFNREPGHFPAVCAPEVSCITLKEMIDFLIQYIKNDQVGVLANAHLAHAANDSIFSGQCLAIAKKFSVAIDFAKNGKSEHLDRTERPNQFPDFMEKNHKEVLKSTKALGKMYRVCKDFESENEDASLVYENVQVDPDLIYPGWENFRDSALKSRNKYISLLRSVLRSYGIQHEAEVFSGAFTHLHCRFQERKDRAEIEKVVIGCIKKLSKSMRAEFLEEFEKSSSIKEIELKILQKASSWYVVTYSDKGAHFLSFPWIVSDYLASIKIRKTLANPSRFSPLIMSMDEQIRKCENDNMLPRCPESYLWKDYVFLCDIGIVKNALRVLILWAQEEDIIASPGHDTSGLLYLEVFIRLFFHIAEFANYVIPKGKMSSTENKATSFSSASLCIEFLRFCTALRFYNKYEIGDILPFTVYKYSKLAKRAVIAYHRFALSGTFKNLYSDVAAEEELIEMKKPAYFESRVFPRIPVDNASLQRAEEALMKYSKVAEIRLREEKQTKKVCVKAKGTEEALKTLKGMLRKKHTFLRSLFNTGVLPEN